MSPRVIDRLELIRSLNCMDDALFRKVAEYARAMAAEAAEEAAREGMKEALLNTVRNLMKTLKLTATQTLDAMKVEETMRDDALTALGR